MATEVYAGRKGFCAEPVFTIDGDEVYAGRKGFCAEPIATIDGEEVYAGRKGFCDEPIATIDGEEVYAGRKGFCDEPIATIDGEEVYAGRKGFCDEPIVTIEGDEGYAGAAAACFLLLGGEGAGLADDTSEEPDSEPADSESSSSTEDGISSNCSATSTSSTGTSTLPEWIGVLVVGILCLALAQEFLRPPKRKVADDHASNAMAPSVPQPHRWLGAVSLLTRTGPGGHVTISGDHRVLLDGLPVTGPLRYAGSETPTRVYLSRSSASGRYTFVSLCDSDWCDDTRLIDLQRGQIVPVPVGKHCVPGMSASWAPDDAYALLTRRHAGESGFFVLDLNNLTTYEPNATLSSLIVTQPSMANDPHPANTSIVANTEAVRWTESRTILFAGNVIETIWTQEKVSGHWRSRLSVVGRILVEMSVPSLSIKPIRRWRSTSSEKPADESGSVGATDESGRLAVEHRGALSGGPLIQAPTSVDGEQKEIYWVEGAVLPPSVIERVTPGYAQEAQADQRKGPVILNLTVGEDGIPRGVWIEQDIGLGLGEKAIEAVKKWRFLPGSIDGRLVSVEATIEIPVQVNADEEVAVKP